MLSQALALIAAVVGSVSLFGCSSTAPAPERSTSEIKNDADKAFKDMKQEEREYRGEGTSPSR